MNYEEVYLSAYASVPEVRRGLEDYLRFYNGLGRHQSLGSGSRPRSSMDSLMEGGVSPEKGDRITGRRAGILG